MTEKLRIIIDNIKLPLDAVDEDAFKTAEKRISKYGCFGNVSFFEIYKKSVDARKKDDIKYVISVTAVAEIRKNIDVNKLRADGIRISFDEMPKFICGSKKLGARPVVVGFGPAGMFAALYLAKYGYKPLVLERGSCVDERVKAVEKFENEGVLDTENNIQFGAGGAGTFSDGKLTTRINDPYVHAVLKELFRMGAPKDILTRAKPHIGTDVLRDVVKNLHAEIEKYGGEIRYNTKVISISNGIVETEDDSISYGVAIIATGHSARDFYKMLMENNYKVESKPFSVGVRIEHIQRDIDISMYGRDDLAKTIGHAEYALSLRKGGRGVYTFCMCPGGKVVAAASEAETVVTNGMSYRARDGINSNAAVAVSVLPSDFGFDPVKAIEFQRILEKNAFKFGGNNYNAPCQTIGDFYNGVCGNLSGRINSSYMNGKVTPCDMNRLLPNFVSSMLKLGFADFGKKIKGFDAYDVPITGVETRTSAPMRILRTDTFEAIGNECIYPCGEGAGYAGGIVSAAVDGIRVAGAIIEKYSSFG